MIESHQRADQYQDDPVDRCCDRDLKSQGSNLQQFLPAEKILRCFVAEGFASECCGLFSLSNFRQFNLMYYSEQKGRTKSKPNNSGQRVAANGTNQSLYDFSFIKHQEARFTKFKLNKVTQGSAEKRPSWVQTFVLRISFSNTYSEIGIANISGPNLENDILGIRRTTYS